MGRKRKHESVEHDAPIPPAPAASTPKRSKSKNRKVAPDSERKAKKARVKQEDDEAGGSSATLQSPTAAPEMDQDEAPVDKGKGRADGWGSKDAASAAEVAELKAQIEKLQAELSFQGQVRFPLVAALC
jgi:hypothetical protein